VVEDESLRLVPVVGIVLARTVDDVGDEQRAVSEVDDLASWGGIPVVGGDLNPDEFELDL
jgi:hypothetical protein